MEAMVLQFSKTYHINSLLLWDLALLPSCIPFPPKKSFWLCVLDMKQNYLLPSPGGSAVKNSPAMQETQVMPVLSLGQKDALQEGSAVHSSILDWEPPWTAEPGELPAVGSHRVGHGWSNWAQTHPETEHTCIYWVTGYPWTVKLFRFVVPPPPHEGSDKNSVKDYPSR